MAFIKDMLIDLYNYVTKKKPLVGKHTKQGVMNIIKALKGKSVNTMEAESDQENQVKSIFNKSIFSKIDEFHVPKTIAKYYNDKVIPHSKDNARSG